MEGGLCVFVWLYSRAVSLPLLDVRVCVHACMHAGVLVISEQRHKHTHSGGLIEETVEIRT